MKSPRRVHEGNSGLPSGCGMRRNVRCEPKKLSGLPERPPCQSKVAFFSPRTGCDKKKNLDELRGDVELFSHPSFVVTDALTLV